jgi:hypothetical protein
VSSEHIAWQNGTYFRDAARIATEWIEREWTTYLLISGCHLWGMLTMANFMDNADRMNVWSALNEVAPSTWGDRPMPTVYPLNRINQPLKWSTALIYRAIRYMSVMTLVLGLISAIIVIAQSYYDSKLSRGCLAVALAVGWCIAHSIPAGLVVFPEFRYTYANMLVLMSGAAAWLAYVFRVLSHRHINANLRSLPKYFSGTFTECANRNSDNDAGFVRAPNSHSWDS